MARTGCAEQHTLSRGHTVLSTLNELLGRRNSKSVTSINLQQGALKCLGELRGIILQLATSSSRPQETREGEDLLTEGFLLLNCCLSLECLLQRLKLAGMRLLQELLLAGVLFSELLIELLVLCNLLFQLCELSLKLGLPQCLSLLVGVDLAGSSEVVE